MPPLSIVLLLLHSATTNLRLFSLALVATAPPHYATLTAATPLFSLLSLSFLSGKMRWAILLPLHFNTIPMQTLPFINIALLLVLYVCKYAHVWFVFFTLLVCCVAQSYQQGIVETSLRDLSR